MSKLLVVVPRSRAYCGRAVLLGADGARRFGPVRVMATASRRVAKQHGNPTCDPLQPFGHPPAGTYVVATSLPPGYAHPRRRRRFGAVGALLLAPRDGDALASVDKGRRVFAIHGGPTDRANRLRPTRGGLRLTDADMLGLLRAINTAQLDDDPLGVVEILEAADADVRTVPASDLRGARRARGRRRARPSGAAAPALLVLLGAGAALRRNGGRRVDRRELLRTALLLVGGITLTSCSRPNRCTPLACDPTDGQSGDGAPSDAGTDADADAGDLDAGALDAGDAGTAHDAGAGLVRKNLPCPPRGYVCEEDDPGYVASGGVG